MQCVLLCARFCISPQDFMEVSWSSSCPGHAHDQIVNARWYFYFPPMYGLCHKYVTGPTVLLLIVGRNAAVLGIFKVFRVCSAISLQSSSLLPEQHSAPAQASCCLSMQSPGPAARPTCHAKYSHQLRLLAPGIGLSLQLHCRYRPKL